MGQVTEGVLNNNGASTRGDGGGGGTQQIIGVKNVSWIVSDVSELPGDVSGPGQTALVVDSNNVGVFYGCSQQTGYNWVRDNNEKLFVGKAVFGNNKNELYVCYYMSHEYDDNRYYYKKVSGAMKKKVYTISADNVSTLDVSADFANVVDVVKNGVEIYENDDYTVSNGVITFVAALSATDKICVKGE